VKAVRAARLFWNQGGSFYGDSCVSEPVSEGVSPPLLWTFLCRRRFDTTENRRPQPSTSQPKAKRNNS
jgi:hypothetical protein